MPKKINNKLIIILVCSILAIIMAVSAILLYVLLKPKENTPNTEPPIIKDDETENDDTEEPETTATVKITNISYDSSNAVDTELSQTSHELDTLANFKIVLGSEIESSITYNITIQNETDYNYFYDDVRYDIGESSYSNEDISFKINGLNKYEVLKNKSTITFKITFCYAGTFIPDNNTLNAILNFRFDTTKQLNNLIKFDNQLITTQPTLTDSNNNTTDPNGLYKSNETDSGKPTYYFRGSVSNNYVSFAGHLWKIIRINENGTVRLILANGESLAFNNSNSTYDKMYYSNNSEAKAHIDNWYKTNILDQNYDSYVATTTFCEAARAKYSEEYTANNATMQLYSDYSPTFKCVNDANGYGIFNSKVGLITYDEAVFAGGYPGKDNSTNYLYMGRGIWTMSPCGYNSVAYLWSIRSEVHLDSRHTKYGYALCPVISLNAELHATGNGTITNPYTLVLEQ